MTTQKDDVAFAKDIAAHYADILGDTYAKAVFYSEKEVRTVRDAERLTKFYWSMVDLAMKDQNNGVFVLGVNNLVFWMDKLMNCVMGYLSRCGYREVWVLVSEAINASAELACIYEPRSNMAKAG